MASSSNNPLLPTFNVGGLASGLDTNSIVTQLMSIEKQPQQRIQTQITLEQQRVTDLTSIKTQLQRLATAAATLSDPDTWSTSATITSSDTAHVSATGTGVPPGGYAIGVQRLARAAQMTQSTAAQKISGDDTLQIDVGSNVSFTVDVTDGETLDAVATAINQHASGHVFASVVNSQLVISGQDTGQAKTIAVSSVGSGTAATQLGMTQTVAPQDAKYTLDGNAQTSASNTITNIATGLSVTLLGVTQSDATITVGAAGPNTTAVTSALQSFASAYNATIDLVDGTVRENKVVNPQSASDQVQGDLNGDPSLLSLLSQLRSAVASVVGGASDKLDVASEAGLSTGGAVGSGPLNDAAIRGDLTLDTSQLSDVLASNFDDVKRLFSHVGSTATQGIAQRISSLVTNYTGTKGVLTGEITGENSLIDSLQQQSADWDVRLTDKEAALRKQFSDMETTLSQLQSQGSWLSSQIAKL